MSSTATTHAIQPPPSSARCLTAWPNAKRSAGGVVERGDDFDVGATGQRAHEVAGAEARVPPAVAEGAADGGSDALHLVGEVSGRHGVGDVVETHDRILSHARTTPSSTPGQA
jgi:hypothetical protein